MTKKTGVVTHGLAKVEVDGMKEKDLRAMRRHVAFSAINDLIEASRRKAQPVSTVPG